MVFAPHYNYLFSCLSPWLVYEVPKIGTKNSVLFEILQRLFGPYSSGDPLLLNLLGHLPKTEILGST